MEDIKIYGHLISGISDDNSSYSNGDNWIAKAHDIYDEGFKNLSEEIVEGSLPVERQDQINRYLYNKVDDIQDKLNNYKLYSIVASLPTSNIDKNKIYIVASEEGVENNIYTEYIYTEDNTWEKLGEFKSDIDLTPYVKKTDESNIKAENLPRYIFGHDKVSGDSFYTFQSQNEVELNHRFIDLQTKTMDIHRSIISSATTEHSGVMSSQDKIKLNKCISSDDYVNIYKSGILPKCPGNPGRPSTFIPIIDSRFAVPVAEWVILKSVSNKDSIKIKPHNSEDNDYHDILILPSATSTTAGVMSADDKVKLDSITNDSLLPNTDDVAGGVSILTAGKTSHAGSTQTSIEWSKLSVERNGYEMGIRGGNASDNTIITLPPATDNEAGLLPAHLYTPLNNKQAIISNLKLSNDTNNTTISDYIVLTRADYQAILDRLATDHEAIKETEPIVITLAYTDSESEENSFDYTQQDPEESRILTEEEIQKSNLAALRNIENLNRPIVIKINDKSYYPTCKTMTKYTGERFIYIEIGELESNYIALISYESVSRGNSSYEDVVIRSRKIHHLVSNFNPPNEASRDYGLIMEGDFWSMWNRLIALEEHVYGPQKP